MTKLPAPKGIIFDWDNTLVDTWPIIHDAINATFQQWNMPQWTIEQTRSRVRKSMRDSFPEIFGTDWQKAGEFYQQHYRANHLNRLTALPGAREVLEKVKAKGLFSVVVSNKKGPNLRQEVEHLGWQTLFDSVIGSDDAKRDKPHIDPVELAFTKTHIRPDAHVWFIGDSEIDLECAVNCGCTAILYGELAKRHPDFTATHYQGFPYNAHVHDHVETIRLLSVSL